METTHTGTTEMQADFFTKPLPKQQFRYLLQKIMGIQDSSLNSRTDLNNSKDLIKSQGCVEESDARKIQKA